MSEMIEQFTETLGDLLKNKGYGEVSQDASLTEVLELMEKFPNFEFGEEIDLSMKELFIKKYDIREIGAETEELFLHYWREKTNELIIRYVPKIQMWLDNFNELFKFTVKLELTDNQFTSNSSQNTYYLNPVSANTEIEKEITVNPTTKETKVSFTGGKLKTQDVDTNDNAGQKNRTITRDVLQSVWGKTRANLLDQIFKLEDIYNSALKEFDVLFMGLF